MNWIISTKTGYRMAGPVWRRRRRKSLLASLDQSLKRMRIDHVDIFYSHRFDPDTPLEETMGALASAVKQGKALYAGVSSYSARKTREASALLGQMGVPCVIHQPSHSMLNRWIEHGLLDTLETEGIGCIVFLAAGAGAIDRQVSRRCAGRVAQGQGAASFRDEHLTEANLERVRQLAAIAEGRGQSLAQMALAWVLRRPAVSRR